MAPGIALAVPPGPDHGSKTTNLQMQIRQIERQNGGLRNVTEESLLTAMARGDSTCDSTCDSQAKTVAETFESTEARLSKVKAELTQCVSYLQEQTLAMIDGLSFPISMQSRVAQNAMSPALRAAAPVGSIETRAVAPKLAPSKQEFRRLNDISIASRAHTFQYATDKLSEASRRLEDECRKQAKYWEQMATLRSHDWPISRLPNNDKAHVVHFGSTELAPSYRDQGILRLRQDTNDDLTVLGQYGARRQKRLSIAVYRGGKLGAHHNLKFEREETTSPLQRELLRARESLSYEELFGEANREARSIANMGVKSRSTSIEFEVCSQYSVKILYGEEKRKEEHHTARDLEIALFIGSLLRLMLVAEHQHRHEQRTTQPPLPMSPTSRASHDYAILRPLIAQLQHQSISAELTVILQAYTRSTKRAGTPFSYENVVDLAKKDAHLSMQSLRRMITSTTRLSFPTGSTIELRVDTHLAPPIFGTRFHPASIHNTCGASSCPQTSSTDDVVTFIEDAIVREVGCLVLDRAVPKPASAHWELLREYPLVLELKEEGKSLATLSLKCHRKSLFAIWISSEDGLKQRTQWNFDYARLVKADGQTQTIDFDLLEAISRWSSDL